MMKAPVWDGLLVSGLLILGTACGSATGASPAGSPSAQAPPTTAAKPAASGSPASVSVPAASGSQAPVASAAKPSGQLRKVTVSYCAPTAAQASIWVAGEAGTFQKYGLDAEVKYVAPVEQVAAVLGRRIDDALCSADNIIAGSLESGDSLQILGIAIPTMQSQFWSQPNIKSAQDLKGKTVGGGGESPNAITYQAQYAVRKLGLNPSSDVRWRHFTNPADVTSSFLSGIVDAAPMFPPDTLKARKAGKQLLYDTPKDNALYPTLSLYARRDQDEATKLAFLKGMLDAIKLYKSDKEFSIKTIMKWGKIEDRDVAEESYNYFAQAIPQVPRTTEEAVKVTLSVMAATRSDAAGADPKRFYDNSYLDKLVEQGFLKQIGAG